MVSRILPLPSAKEIWKDNADMQLMYMYKYDDDYKTAKAYLAAVLLPTPGSRLNSSMSL